MVLVDEGSPDLAEDTIPAVLHMAFQDIQESRRGRPDRLGSHLVDRISDLGNEGDMHRKGNMEGVVERFEVAVVACSVGRVCFVTEDGRPARLDWSAEAMRETDKLQSCMY